MGWQGIDFGRRMLDVISSSPTTVKAEMFGAIATSIALDYLDDYEYFVSQADVQLLRWPGGTFAENGVIVGDFRVSIAPDAEGVAAYDLKYPDLLHPGLLYDEQGRPTGRPGLSDILSMAAIRGTAVSIILPTERYSQSPSEAYNDVSVFLRKLFIEGAYSGGAIPQRVVLDVGNENYSPVDYGPVAAAILAAIRDFRSASPDFDFEVGLQAMQSGPLSQELISALFNSSFGVEYDNLFAEVDMVRVHSLNHSIASISNIEDRSQVYWSILRLQREIELAYRRDGRSDESVDLYFSAFTTNSNDVEVGLSAGLPAASAMLSLFTSMLELGADRAAAWGVAAGNPAPTSMSYRATDGEQLLTPLGLLYGLMAKNLIGTDLVATDTIDAGRLALYNTYAFAGSDRSVVYVSANDIGRAPVSVTIDFVNAQIIRDYSVTVVSAVDGISGEGRALSRVGVLNGTQLTFQLQNSYEIVQIVISHRLFLNDGQIVREPTIPEAPILGNDSGIIGVGLSTDDIIFVEAGMSSVFGGRGFDTLDFSRISASAVVDMMQSRASFGTFQLEFSSIEKFVLGNQGTAVIGSPRRDVVVGGNGADTVNGFAGDDRIDGDGGSDYLNGGRGNDVIYGGSENDVLVGGEGSDALYGEAGNDTIYGGAHDDTVIGGGGSDFLSGGRGADTFVFRRSFGNDVVSDFRATEGDKIDLSKVRFLFESGFDDIVESARSDGSAVVLNFAANHSIRLLDFGLSDLNADIFIL